VTDEIEVHEYVTIGEATKVIPTTEQVIRNLIYEGKLKSIKVGGIEKVSRHDLESLDPDDYMGLYLV
jgi:hypothetical protein